jgi:hypothetical protein
MPAAMRATRRAIVADIKKVNRLLQDLKVTENFLRQYPHLAEKIAAALAKAGDRPA